MKPQTSTQLATEQRLPVRGIWFQYPTCSYWLGLSGEGALRLHPTALFWPPVSAISLSPGPAACSLPSSVLPWDSLTSKRRLLLVQAAANSSGALVEAGPVLRAQVLSPYNMTTAHSGYYLQRGLWS